MQLEKGHSDRHDRSAICERLLLAGLQVFAARGYGGTTVREICAVAKSNIAAVNYHFGDKARFYLAVKDYARSRRQELLRRCWDLSSSLPWAALRLHIGILLDSTYDNVQSQVNWILLRELLDGPPVHPECGSPAEQSAQRREYEENLTRLLSALLQDASSQENINLLRYTYYSICLFLPIHTHCEEKLLGGQGRFALKTTDKESLTEYIFSIVKRTVEDMREKSAMSPAKGNVR
ncbi:MAG: TetR/AcrR family transcriptional regulator [Oligosphaeraceae bacterium]|nr:TetR/AcrR family transcriptional regulator [Oligosphaeraceae bacterium]